MQKYKNIKYELIDNTALLEFNNPPVNVLNMETLDELAQLINDVSENTKVKVVILIGAGRSFIAGADLADMKKYGVLQARKFAQKGQETLKMLENMAQPVIAAINGFALGGGCEVALACDIRIASEKAQFAQPEVNLGIIPGFGGTQRLARTIGIGRAKELIFTGDMIDAKTAESIGLVNRVVEHDNLKQEALLLAQKISSRGPVAISMAKTVINKGLQCDLDTACSIEADAFGICFSTNEPNEGMKAFLQTKQYKVW